MPLMLVSGHMVLTVSLMAPFHVLGQDDQKEMELNIFGHVMPLASASASSHANGFINSTTAFALSR